MDFHMGRFGRPFNTWITSSDGIRHCGWDFPQNHRRRPKLSASLLKAKKQLRDRSRMTAFILKKTAQNLPFSSLDDAEVAKMAINTSLRARKEVPVAKCSVSVQTEDDAIVQVEELRVENEQLRQKLSNMEADHKKEVKTLNSLIDFWILTNQKNESQIADLRIDQEKIELSIKQKLNDFFCATNTGKSQQDQRPRSQQYPPQHRRQQGWQQDRQLEQLQDHQQGRAQDRQRFSRRGRWT